MAAAVCSYWRAGRCSRYPCSFVHSELPQSTNKGMAPRQSLRNSSGNKKWSREDQSSGCGVGVGGESNAHQKSTSQTKVCKYWMEGRCSYGKACKFLHQWFSSDSFTMLTKLGGHDKVIKGIAFPLGSDKLFSGSKDQSVRVWDCQSGQSAGACNLEGEIGCMISEGPWVFVGLPNVVKAWNSQTNATRSLSTGSTGQVYSLAVSSDGMLLAGTHNGSICVWKLTDTTDGFDAAEVTCLKGHSSGVVSLCYGANRLYSGSTDKTIRVWDLDTMKCIHVLEEHTAAVMSVLCWEDYLLSCSLDQTVKVWALTEKGNLEVVYTHKQEHGVLRLCGMTDSEAKPVLICSYNDNTVRVYDLPSFTERGRIFSKAEIRVIEAGPGGLFFTGDGNGELKVWKMA